MERPGKPVFGRLRNGMVAVPWRPQIVVGCIGALASTFRVGLAAAGNAAKQARSLAQALEWTRIPDVTLVSSTPDAGLAEALWRLRDEHPEVALFALSPDALPVLTRCMWYERGVSDILEPPILEREVIARVVARTALLHNGRHRKRAVRLREEATRLPWVRR